MKLDTVFFTVPDEIADDLTERILSLAASPLKYAVPGFETPVDSSLLSGLSFLENQMEGRREKGPAVAVRLYETAGMTGRKMLLVGENLTKLLPELVEIVRAADVGAQHQASANLALEPGKEEWSLVGMAFEGWILLFDPDGEEVQKSQTNENTMILSLPAPSGCPLETLSPKVTTFEAMAILIRHLLLLLSDEAYSRYSPTEP